MDCQKYLHIHVNCLLIVPILDTATFDALQLMLDAQRRQQRSEVFYVLSGLVHCGCGAKFEATKTGGKRYYYRCSQHCGERAWRKEVLELEIYQTFWRYLEKGKVGVRAWN